MVRVVAESGYSILISPDIWAPVLRYVLFCSFRYCDFVFRQAVEGMDEAVDLGFERAKMLFPVFSSILGYHGRCCFCNLAVSKSWYIDDWRTKGSRYNYNVSATLRGQIKQTFTSIASIVTRHAELQFVGFDELGFFYLLVPSTIVFRHASMLNPAAAHHEPSMHIPSTAYW